MPAFLRISENVRNIRVTKFKEIIIKSLAKVEIREMNIKCRINVSINPQEYML